MIVNEGKPDMAKKNSYENNVVTVTSFEYLGSNVLTNVHNTIIILIQLNGRENWDKKHT